MGDKPSSYEYNGVGVYPFIKRMEYGQVQMEAGFAS